MIASSISLLFSHAKGKWETVSHEDGVCVRRLTECVMTWLDEGQGSEWSGWLLLLNLARGCEVVCVCIAEWKLRQSIIFFFILGYCICLYIYIYFFLTFSHQIELLSHCLTHSQVLCCPVGAVRRPPAARWFSPAPTLSALPIQTWGAETRTLSPRSVAS